MLTLHGFLAPSGWFLIEPDASGFHLRLLFFGQLFH